MILQVVMLGRVDYSKALKIQERILKLRQQEDIIDTLLLLEHPPVITIGQGAGQENILVPIDFLKEQGIEVYKINRGGDVTFHGPGQIVGYPILDLKNHGKGVHLYINNIEETFIRLLSKEYGIMAGRDPKNRGVWVESEKITAIGCTVKKWVSMHGFAFNVNTDLDYFKLINPCGITDKGVTSLQKILGTSLDINLVSKQVISSFADVFGVETRIVSEQALEQMIGGVKSAGETP